MNRFKRKFQQIQWTWQRLVSTVAWITGALVFIHGLWIFSTGEEKATRLIGAAILCVLGLLLLLHSYVLPISLLTRTEPKKKQLLDVDDEVVVETSGPTPCLCCGKELESAFSDGHNSHQPYDAVMFTTHGNYGSRVFDSVDGSILAINICDRCLISAPVGRVWTRRVYQVTHEKFSRPWVAPEVSDDETDD